MRPPGTVKHRWNLDAGQDPPEPGQTLRGMTKAHSWRVVAVDPVESPIHPNAFVGTLEKLGPWELDDPFDLYYRGGRHAPPPNCR